MNIGSTYNYDVTVINSKLIIPKESNSVITQKREILLLYKKNVSQV